MYLEQRVEELEKQVVEMKKVINNMNPYYELDVKWITTPSKNQQRKQLIQDAKDFVSELLPVITKSKSTNNKFNTHNVGWGNSTTTVAYRTFDKVEFKVDYKNRKVLIYLYNDGEIQQISKAKCLDCDVFNVHVGKAIALGKVLGLDVSKFTDAVQPDEVVIGHVIKSRKNKGITWEIKSLEGKNNLVIKEHYLKSTIGNRVTYELNENDKVVYIVDDTNAKY